MNRVVRWTNVPLDAVFLVFSLPRKRMEDIKVTPKLGLLAFFWCHLLLAPVLALVFGKF